MDGANAHFAHHFQDLAADASHADHEDSGVGQLRGCRVDEFADSMHFSGGLCLHDLASSANIYK